MRERRRDATWFEELYRSHHAAVLRYAIRRVGGGDADDVVAEVFATAWRRPDAVGEPPLPWLYRTAHHHVLHLNRDHARRSRLHLRLASEAATRPAVDDGPAPSDAPGQTLDLLAHLPADDAELLRLVAWEGLTPTEIAYVLGLKPGTVRVRLHRARQRAEALLETARHEESDRQLCEDPR